MNDTPVQPATRTSRGTASRLINLAGVILLIVAAALYWRDMQVNKEKAAAAGMVRLNATTPMIAMGLMLDSTGAAQNILIGCPRDIATNIISKLAQVQKLELVLVTGHTDPIGTQQYNQKLSERRADAVRDYLVSKGVPKDKIETLGMGKTQPLPGVVCNQKNMKELIACLAPNRRVEVEVKGEIIKR